jgi:hypothetical protein
MADDKRAVIMQSYTSLDIGTLKMVMTSEYEAVLDLTTGKRNPMYSERNLPHCHFVHNTCIWAPLYCHEQSGTNCLSCVFNILRMKVLRLATNVAALNLVQ